MASKQKQPTDSGAVAELINPESVVDNEAPIANGGVNNGTTAETGIEGDIQRLVLAANQHIQPAKSHEAMFLKTLGAIDVLKAIAKNNSGESNGE